MTATVTAIPTLQPVEIFELRRGEHDQPYWHPVGNVTERGSLSTVLTRWLYAEDDRLAGTYRAVREGEKPFEASWTGDELAA